MEADYPVVRHGLASIRSQEYTLACAGHVFHVCVVHAKTEISTHLHGAQQRQLEDSHEVCSRTKIKYTTAVGSKNHICKLRVMLRSRGLHVRPYCILTRVTGGCLTTLTTAAVYTVFADWVRGGHVTSHSTDRSTHLFTNVSLMCTRY